MLGDTFFLFIYLINGWRRMSPGYCSEVVHKYLKVVYTVIWKKKKIMDFFYKGKKTRDKWIISIYNNKNRYVCVCSAVIFWRDRCAHRHKISQESIPVCLTLCSKTVLFFLFIIIIINYFFSILFFYPIFRVLLRFLLYVN